MGVSVKSYVPLVGSTGLFFTTFMAWTSYAPLGPVFQKEFHMTPILLGALLGMPKIFSLFTRYVAGYMSDRFGARNCLIVLGLVSSLAVGVTGLASGLTELFLAAFILGIAGSIFPV